MQIINPIISLESSCESFGLVPNDPTEALENYTKLLLKLKEGVKILVDDVYYIQSPYNSTTSIENEINFDVVISGMGRDKSKLILDGGYFFKPKKNVRLEGVSIETVNNLNYLFVYAPPYESNTIIRDNFITGDVRVVTANIPIAYDFDAFGFCGFRKLKILDNEFYDVYNNNGGHVIFRLIDAPVNLLIIKNNIVTNFSYIFYDNGITNGGPNITYLLQNNKEAYIEGNRVTCTDDYDVKGRNSGYMGTYYCFALLEGFHCECKNNVFEGIHIFDAPSTVVYDNYFSVTNLWYENNTWKNNVNFTAGIEYIDIMKSKPGFHLNGEPIERVYRNNSYIVKQDYADRFNKDPFLLRKYLCGYQTDIDKVIIENNYFDMYILASNYGGQEHISDYVFRNNTIKTVTSERSTLTQAWVYIGNEKDVDGVPIPRRVIFTNNVIVSENPPSGSAIGSKEQSILWNIAGSDSKTTVIFENNHIEGHDLKYVFKDIRADDEIVTEGLCGANIIFYNNYIKNNTAALNSYLICTKFKDISFMKNNKFDFSVSDSGYLFYERGTPISNLKVLPVCVNSEIDIKYTAEEWFRVLPMNGLFDANYTVNMHISILSPTSYEEFDIAFTIRNNGSYNIVECFGKDLKAGESVFSSKSYIMDGTGNAYGNFYIQKDNIKGTQKVNVNVANSTVKEIMLNKFGGDRFKNDHIKITMTIVPVG